MFADFYNSWLQQPLLLWIPQIAFTLWLLPKGKSTLVKLALGFSILSFLDAWLTANWVVGVGTLPANMASVVPVFFVIAGDFRYFFSADLTKVNDLKYWFRSGLWSFAVPLLVFPLKGFMDMREMFLLYEVLFLIVAFIFYFRHKGNPAFLKLTKFVLFYYFLWALADVIILTTGSDWGFALRIIPNVLYYGLWAPLLYRSYSQT